MLSLYYQDLGFAKVEDLNDFYRGSLPEIPKIKAMVSAVRLLYSLPPNRVELHVSQGDRVYKILLRGSRKGIFGWLVYLPLEKRLDLYSLDSLDFPLIQWKDKKAVTKNYNQIFIDAGIEKVFDGIVNNI